MISSIMILWQYYQSSNHKTDLTIILGPNETQSAVWKQKVRPTQESCLIGRLRVGLLRGEGELSDAEKKGLRSFSSTPTGLCVSGSEGETAGVGERLTGEIKWKSRDK